MKKAILMATFMLSAVSFANETKREGILPKNEKITDAVTHENLEESLGFCITETYVHFREIEYTAGMFDSNGLVLVKFTMLEVYISGACTTCVSKGLFGDVTTVDCWGSRFPPIGW